MTSQFEPCTSTRTLFRCRRWFSARIERGSTRISERRFSIRVDAGPWFRVTHVRPEGDDPISLSILLDPSAMDLMPNLSREIANLAPIFLTPRDHVSLYSLGCGLTRSLDDKPADNARLLDRVDVLVAPWRAVGGKGIELHAEARLSMGRPGIYRNTDERTSRTKGHSGSNRWTRQGKYAQME